MSQHRPHARDERGFSMFLVIMALLVTSLFVAAAYAAANGDLPMSGGSKDRKATYAAAEAGLNFYAHHLNQDNDYWTLCDQVPAPNPSEPNPVNQAWDGQGADPRRWRNVPGSTAQYTIELLPTEDYRQQGCVVGDQKSLIDLETGTFKMRFTGRPAPESDIRRSIVATFRRGGFLDYLYFTDFENLDPQAESTLSERTWALANCANRYRAARPSGCTEIQFITGDRNKGPFHTNDDILTCGTPIFGRNQTDRVEFSGPAPGWRRGPGCSGAPDFVGTPKTGVEKLVLPTTNDELLRAAQAGGNVYTGTTHIRVNSNDTMTVRTGTGSPYPPSAPQPANTVPLPDNGVVYVQTGSGGCSINNPPPVANYATEPRSCGNLYVSGTYSSSLTFGADNDIIVGSDYDASHRDLVKDSNSDAVVGLIAKNFVRVYHKVNRTSTSCSNANTASDVTIDAAILSLQHSFITDNYGCGAPLGELHVTGAIAQKYRGTVGRHSGGTPINGFLKDYTYDDRLRFRSPPYFLPPVDAAWTVLRRNEQVPAN